MYTTIVSCETLNKHLDDPGWVIVDCRFDLSRTLAGYIAYQEAHIPGAVYAHLDDDLSGPPVTDAGRHPLPTAQAMRVLFGHMGIGDGTQVVVYDGLNGAIAARLWWMLRYMGHPQVAVLDGCWPAWKAARFPVKSGVEENSAANFNGQPHTERLVRLNEVDDLPLLIDSRGPERYRGEMEPIDPVAGHIPGAVNFFYQNHWTKEGRYIPAAEMGRQLSALFGETPPEQVTFHCGSGVTACVNLLAMVHAGLGDGRLYVGSWSEWIRDPERPVATG